MLYRFSFYCSHRAHIGLVGSVSAQNITAADADFDGSGERLILLTSYNSFPPSARLRVMTILM